MQLSVKSFPVRLPCPISFVWPYVLPVPLGKLKNAELTLSLTLDRCTASARVDQKTSKPSICAAL